MTDAATEQLRLMERNSAPVRLRKIMHDSQPIATHWRFWIYQTGYSRISKLSTFISRWFAEFTISNWNIAMLFFSGTWCHQPIRKNQHWNPKDLTNCELPCPPDIHITRTSVETPSSSRLWFQLFFIFTPTWGNDSIWLIFFRWVENTN